MGAGSLAFVGLIGVDAVFALKLGAVEGLGACDCVRKNKRIKTVEPAVLLQSNSSHYNTPWRWQLRP